ncbi:2OG-Fe(II) oxygenase [Chromatiales bacterium (ex Bugula neritina AB1)]|nr:2OG-Fe(II) oxygenase [Chromatiales bacterium (ex Bugula neritina AB1)]
MNSDNPDYPQPVELVPNSHIYCVENTLPLSLCSNMIERFESATDEQYPGRVGQTEQENLQVKRSTDLVISGKPHWRDIDRSLFSSLASAMRFMRQHNAFFSGRFKDYGYAIQRTDPGEFFHWHVDSGSHSFSDRQLVAIWYLNDVPGPGGETEFRHQQIKIKPETGKLLLFPPFWTHEHRGVTLQAGVKYIATTWVLFA